MYEIDVDGRLQVTAGVSLLQCSRLVEWRLDQTEFAPVPRETFEISWRRDVDPVFGRLVCWMNFSAGAEMLAKGLCLLHNVEIRSTKTVPAYPTGDLAQWSTAYLMDCNSRGTMPCTDYGTLRNLVDKSYKSKLPPGLPRLFNKINASDQDRKLLLAAYGILASSIRNRDAHAYVPNVRDSHFPLVGQLFARCFNLLASWLPGGSATLNLWRREAPEFNASR